MKSYRALITVLLLAAAQLALAKDVVKLIVPTAPGGGTDVLFRAIARQVEPFLDATVVILNESGAGGTIGVSGLTRAAPDGKTIAGVWMGPITVAPHTIKTTYGLDDYIPVIQLDSAPYVLCVRNDFPAKDGKAFIEELRKHPDKYTYGTDGVAGPGQLSVERVFKALGISARDIPYKGAGETMPALLGRVIDIYSGSVPLGVNLEKNGQGKCLLATSAKRISALPNALGLEELGIADHETLLWHGIIVPKGTPAREVEKIQTAFEKAANSPDMISFFETAGVEKSIIVGDALKKRIRQEYDALGELIVSLGLKQK
ncbi:tripartite tricarboxylate transporter substrate binding protein [Pollutimonas bauzanensis]|uniref:Tripartite-type tricarboxylate transporter, receptor component TctC n=1 Tax=Pollutimonas bauzanensis TaxID=658167 RepID=A0A1M6B0T8_9BURK|nr:tripartite tricarboxylate transporter substrate binding protein [Pollutimonas bauzanensis]SHI42188.1 Tripartite-type tricarboxylate transporter, receptor component TctC [Pollutimonas bauzanensis]